MPDWKNGAALLDYDETYCSEKEWVSLLLSGGYDESLEEYIAALDAYFEMVRKNLITVGKSNRRIQYAPSPRFSSFNGELKPAPEQPLLERYEENPQKLVTQVVTGFEVADIFSMRYRNALERKLGVSLFGLEEGFANFVSCSLTGQDIDQLDKLFRQDEAKITLAKETARCAGKKGIMAKQALAKVRSYPDLYQFYKDLGIV